MTIQTKDIEEMLDFLGLAVSAECFHRIVNSPDIANYSSLQFMEERR